MQQSQKTTKTQTQRFTKIERRVQDIEDFNRETDTDLVHIIQDLQLRIWTLEKEHGKHG